MIDSMKAVVSAAEEELLAVEIQPQGPLMAVGQSGFTSHRSKVAENTDKTRLQDTRKLE